MRKLLLAWGAAVLALSFAPAVAQDAAPGSDSRPIACAYNPTLPTLVSGHNGLVQCDIHGQLIISNPGSGGGGGGSSGPVYGPTPIGSPPTQPPLFDGFKDASGNAQGASPSTPFPTADQNAASTITSPGTAAVKSQSVQGSNGQALANAANQLLFPGLGSVTAVPAATSNGTALGALPTNGRGARIYLHPGDAISYTIQSSAPTSAPSAAATLTVTQPSSATSFTNIDENLAAGEMVYVTATTGSPSFRWF